MKIIISNINPTDMETVRNIFLAQGKNSLKPLNVMIPPNMKSMFEAAFANRYWDKSELKWTLPKDVSEEYYFALDDSTDAAVMNGNEKLASGSSRLVLIRAMQLPSGPTASLMRSSTG